MEKNYWAIHFGTANTHANLGYEKGFIGIGWNELGDLSQFQELDRRQFFNEVGAMVQKGSPEKSVNARGQSVGQIFRFVKLIQPGDIVLMPKTDENIMYIGVVEGGYYFLDNTTDGCDYKHRRKIKWIKTIDLVEISQPLKNAIGAILTVFSVSDHGEEIEKLSAGGETSQDVLASSEFALESHLEEFIVSNWSSVNELKNYDILMEDGQQVGQQYVTPIGRIDILAKSKDGKEWLVIELKKGKNNDQVVGQILRYMGWIGANESKDGETIKGLIITRDNDDKLIYALKATQNISLMNYKVNFELKKVDF